MKELTVLLVDDEKEFVDNLVERLRLRGIEPKVAYSGEEAIELARKENIHVAIVDLKMPGIDGLVTIEKLREINPAIKTCLLTAFGNEKVKQATEALDSDYFDKGEMGHFWDFIKRLPKKVEDMMAAAGMASQGGLEDAQDIAREKEKKS